MYGLLHYETACCYNALGVYNYKQKVCEALEMNTK